MHIREIEEIVRTRKPFRGEVPFTGPSGISGVYDYIFKPVLDDAGEVAIIVGTTRDVTDRKKGEEKLARAQRELSDRASISTPWCNKGLKSWSKPSANWKRFPTASPTIFGRLCAP